MKACIISTILLALCVAGIHQTSKAAPLYRSEVSNHCVLDIKQDSCGFVWVATAKGLCKCFDYTYEIFFTDPDDPHSISSNQIKGMYTDKDGRLWITTAGGVCALDADRKAFDRYTIEGAEQNDIYGFGFVEFADKMLFYGGHGIYTLNPENKTMKLIYGIEGESPIQAIVGNDGQLWVTNGTSLMALDHMLTPTVRLQFDGGHRIETIANNGNMLLLGTPVGVKQLNPKDLSITDTSLGEDIAVNHILDTGDGRYLISTSNAGVVVYDGQSGETGKVFNNIDFSQLPTYEVNMVFIDNNKNVWVGTFDKGVLRYTDRPHLFNVDLDMVNAFRNEFATRVLFDSNNNPWVGTRYNGVAFYDRDRKRLEYLNSKTVDGLSGFANDFVQEMTFDSKGRLWIGYNNNLIVCRPNINGTEGNNLISVLKIFPLFNSVVCIAEDAKGHMWVCTDNRGIYVIDSNMNIIHTIGTPVVHSNNITKAIRYDDDHMLFSAYNDNVYIVDINTMKVKKFDSDQMRKLENTVDMMFDSDGNLWFGTYNHGLLRHDAKTNAITTCLGSQTDDMVALCQDGKGDIWVSSSYGIYRFDTEGNLLNSYLMRDGLGGNQFHEKCVARSSDGKIYFGGNAGIEEISADSHTLSSHKIPVYLTRIWKMPERTPVLTGKMEGRAEHSVDEITLRHNESSINLEFFGVDYDSATYLEYAYMLEGQDDDFFNLGTYNTVTYSNLPPGSYDFYVKVRYKDGEWQEPVKLLTVNVRHNPWLSPWAIAVYVLIALALLYLSVQAYLRIKLARQKYALANERVEHEKQIAANKLNFFTNISHELRTPLTLICGPAKHLKAHFKSMSDKEVEESMDFIDSNIDRLLTLINQLLNFRKVNTETLPLRVSTADIGKHLETMAAVYRIYAGENGLKVTVELPKDQNLVVTYDVDKLEKIVSNLIVNAIKYSPDKGDINMRLELVKNPAGIDNPGGLTYAKLSVADHGKGVEEVDIPKIFKPFRRLFDIKDEAGNPNGYGIGLNFVMHLVKEHKGIINASRNPEGGMIFTAIFPVSAEAFSDEERLDHDTVKKTSEPAAPDTAPETDAQSTIGTLDVADDAPMVDTDGEQTAEELPKLLIVEDNETLNTFLQNIFKDSYTVIAAHNGAEGLQKAVDECPDIIVSDIIMPGDIDGIKLCQEVRNHEATSHIPVILMTAKAMDESRIEGFNSGADAYIVKPFNPDVLVARVKNLLDKRHRNTQIVLATAGAENPEESVNVLPADELAPLDKKFLEKLYAYIDKYIDDCELNVNLLGRELGYSRTNFYRKVKALTGISPNDLLRVYRLNRAAELLLTREYTIGEVGEKTGFGNQSHFSSLFKKHFGMSPRAYLAERFGTPS